MLYFSNESDFTMKIYRQTKKLYDLPDNVELDSLTGNGSIKVSVHFSDIVYNDALATLFEYAKDAHNSNWYVDANFWANSVAKQYNLSLKTVCDVTALISPMCEWSLNKKRAERIFEAWQRGEKISVSFKKTMVNVYNCLEGKPFAFGPKTGPFAQAIFEPTNPNNLVVIDSLAMQIILGMGDIPASVGFKENTLQLAQQIYIDVAQVYGVSPVSLQAATWQKANVRRKMNRNIIPNVLGDLSSLSLTITEFLERIKNV